MDETDQISLAKRFGNYLNLIERFLKNTVPAGFVVYIIDRLIFWNEKRTH